MKKIRFFLLLTLLITQPPSWAEGEADQGQSLYARKCSICHGKDGVAKKMATGSANLNDPEWQEATSLEDIATVISEGRNKMLPYKTKLTPTHIQQIAQYVKTLK